MKYLLLISLAFLVSCSSENKKVEGEVLTEGGEPLEQVMVQVMGTDLYAYTNEDGYFAINTKSRGDELIFNLEGYKLGREAINDDEFMQVSLVALSPKMKTEAKVEQDSISD